MMRSLSWRWLFAVSYNALLCFSTSSAFVPTRNHGLSRNDLDARQNIHAPSATALSLSADDQALAFWMLSFSSLHIGMSATRNYLIQACGDAAESLKLVNRKWITLPSYWPGDSVGKDQIIPDKTTAGRQIYRAIYTTVSFATLLSALSAYLSSTAAGSSKSILGPLYETDYKILFGIASVSFGASIASLFNASPLSLMPGFQEGTDGVLVERNDSLKLRPYGLTRITRHPLILPVVPWGNSTALLQGDRVADLLFFGGLSTYAVAGCAAQDLRISRKEGSVGTTFRPDESLQEFYSSTSFVPFGAVVDGRQALSTIIREVPWLAFFGGSLVGAVLQQAILTWLQHTAL